MTTPAPDPLAPADQASPMHGGDLDGARVLFPDAPQPWIDLSTGINPRSYPFKPIPETAYHRLPAHSAIRAAEAAAAEAFGLGAAGEMVATPGTQAVLQILPRLLQARRVAACRVAILGFGYQEHPAVWRAAGATVTVTNEFAVLAEADVAVVVNPNNPDGRLVEADTLASLARSLASRGGTLVVDEAFADTLDPAASLLPNLPEAGAIVLRSFGKFFGLAGLRLGFVGTNGMVAADLRRALGPWAVSGPALAVAAQALPDRAWQQTERARLRAEAGRLDQVLRNAGFIILGGTSLFRLVEHRDARAWYARLGQAGILVRPFPERPSWLRFGMPGDAEAWERLEQALMMVK